MKHYRRLFVPDHPNASAQGYVYEHRLVAEKKLGRFLTKEEIVHHVDGDKYNNSPDNLQVKVVKEPKTGPYKYSPRNFKLGIKLG